MLKIIEFWAPSMGRGTFYCIRLFWGTSNVTLNTASDGASTTSLGNLFHCLVALIVKNFFLIANLTFLLSVDSPYCLVLSLNARVKKSLSGFLDGPIGYWKATIIFSEAFSSPTPPSFRLSSEQRCSSPLIIFVFLFWTYSSMSMSYLFWGPQDWRQYSMWGLKIVDSGVKK